MRENADRELPWTGERLVPSCRGQVLYEHLHRYAIAVSLIKANRVLDIACGEGYGSNLLAQTSAEVIGVDIDPEVIAHATRAYPRQNLSFRQGSCLEIPLPDHSIDLVVSFETIEHIDDPAGFLREIKRVLTTEGLVIISSPDKAEYSAGAKNPFHKRELYHEEFESLLQQHFKKSRTAKQKVVAGSWIAPETPSSGDVFGTFSGDIHGIAFQPGVRSGVYSLALCSDASLPEWKLGVYANTPESENIWNLLDRFGSAEDIRNEVASLDRVKGESQHKSALLEAARERLAENRERDRIRDKLLLENRVKLAQKETRVRELTADLRRQLGATKKLSWFLKEAGISAARLRSSRRWLLANPFAAIRRALGGRALAGYGHLEKVLRDYSTWLSSHSEVAQADAKIAALESDVSPELQLQGRNGSPTVSNEPPVPTRAIEFPSCADPHVSIVIPVFNQLSFTRSCLASIQEQSGDEKLEVIVVDDFSTDGTAETLSHIPGLIYLRNDTNIGFIASCNRGAASARGKYLLFLNNDTVVTPGWLSALVETFLEPQAGLVGCKLVYPDGRLQEAGGIIWRDASGWNRGKFDDASKPEYNYLREVDYCSAACLMLLKSLFEQVGGFDLRYIPAYYEDTDLAFKVRAAGLRVLYQPLSEVVHYEGATGGTDLSSGTKSYQNINRSTFAAKWAEVLQTKPVNGDVATLERLPTGGKRILIIDHHLPMPDRDSGSLRMFEILKILHALGHRITFVPDNFSATLPYANDLRKRGVEVIARPHFKSIREYLETHGGKLDAILLSRCGTAQKHIQQVHALARQARVIFDTVDLHFLRTEREADLRQDAASRERAREIQKQEYQLIDVADETWVVSEAERELVLRDCPEARIEVVSNIVEVHEPIASFADRTDFLFIGSFLHPPNVDAVLFFAREILPLILPKLPGAKFYVIGQKAPAEIVALESDSVIVTGAIPDVRPFFESVKLSVAPIRFGAGVKGKINQSMAFGVPVVATSIAVEGMSLTDGEEVLVADEPRAFAQAMVDLYQSEETWHRLSTKAAAKAKLLYSAETARRQLARLFSDDHMQKLATRDRLVVTN